MRIALLTLPAVEQLEKMNRENQALKLLMEDLKKSVTSDMTTSNKSTRVPEVQPQELKTEENAAKSIEDLRKQNSKMKEILKLSDTMAVKFSTLKTEHLNLKTEHQNLVTENQRTNETLSEVKKVARIFKKKSEDAAQELATLRAQMAVMANENKKLQLFQLKHETVDVVDL